MASFRKRGCKCPPERKRCTCGATWEFRLSVIDPVTGKRKQPGLGGFKTKQEAELAAAEMLLKYETGSLSASAKIETVGSFMRKFLDTVLKNEVDETTLEGKIAQMEKYIIPSLGNIKIQNLTPVRVQAFINELIDKNLSAGTIQNIIRLLNQTINKAVEWGYVTKNVVTLTSKPSYKPKKFEVWNKEQFTYFLQETKDSRFYPFYLIGLMTGMRPGEIQALSWDYVIFDKNIIRVERTVARTKERGIYIKESPKNESSIRNITVPASVMQYLKKLKMSQSPNEHNLVVPGIKSPIAYISVIGQVMAKDIEKTGLPKITPHDLRHTHATYLLSPPPFGLGQSIKAVSERLGHAKTMTTLNTYTHVLPNMQESLADQLDRALNL